MKMAALVENMFSVRETPWHGMGIIVQDAPTSLDAIKLAGLDWKVEQREMCIAGTDLKVPDAYANIRTSDMKVLGVVGNRYQIVQNEDAFSFTDNLIGEGCVYETAGSLREGKQIWLLARLPESIQIAGDEVVPYLVFTNTFDGSGAIKVAMTPTRVVCNNTLNLALQTAKRTWSARHTGSIEAKLEEATETLQLANKYMAELKAKSEELALKPIDNDKLIKLIDFVIPVPEDMKGKARENLVAKKNDIWRRYQFAPDLKVMDKTALRFVHAVADTATHMEPARRTKNYRENLFLNTMNGNALIDKAYDVAMAV
jgi:phage/plasmid-like protein (TIGR03299 family)